MRFKKTIIGTVCLVGVSLFVNYFVSFVPDENESKIKTNKIISELQLTALDPKLSRDEKLVHFKKLLDMPSKDGWNRNFRVKSDKQKFEYRSAGPNGIFDDGDDIFWTTSNFEVILKMEQ